MFYTKIHLGSPNHQHLITHPTVITASGQKPKSKKRPKSSMNNNSPTSPEIEGAATTVRRKPSVKKANTKKVGYQVQWVVI